MRISQDRIITTHSGSLPRPDDLLAANQAREEGAAKDEAAFQKLLRSSVAGVVRKQKDAGIDVPNDGEFGKSMGQSVNYRAWSMYVHNRVAGLDLTGADNLTDLAVPGTDGIVLRGLNKRRDRVKFAAAYGDHVSGVWMGPGAAELRRPVIAGPIKYTGHAAIASDIANLKAALNEAGVEQGFMTSIAPGSAVRLANTYYKNEDDLLIAFADALREEYKAIVDAGLILQLDDPSIAESWDSIDPVPPVASYQRFAMKRVEALNHALRGLPPDRIRFHLCWGSWHGPHTTDLPMRDIVEVMLKVNAREYSFEAGNVRHEHEWTVWREVKLPDDKVILPGVVSHATNVVEHPDLVAQRLVRFAEGVGKERVIASTDCGLGGRVHWQIAWAKLEALAEGARRASKQLWK